MADHSTGSEIWRQDAGSIDTSRATRATGLTGSTLAQGPVHTPRVYALTNARIISSKETLETLSLTRLGVDLGILPGITRRMVNELFILTQPGHLQKVEGSELESMERDVARARFIREFVERN